MFLTAADLAELTGRKHRARQLDWLVRHNWPHEVSDTGRAWCVKGK
jgi:hypothetical protein